MRSSNACTVLPNLRDMREKAYLGRCKVGGLCCCVFVNCRYSAVFGYRIYRLGNNRSCGALAVFAPPYRLIISNLGKRTLSDTAFNSLLVSVLDNCIDEKITLCDCSLDRSEYEKALPKGVTGTSLWHFIGRPISR